MSQTRRDIMAFLVAISVGTVTIGGVAPIAFDRMFEKVGDGGELLIAAGETHGIPAGQTEEYYAVEWTADTAQLYWAGNGAQLNIT